MRITDTIRYPATTSVVSAMLADPGFVKAKVQATGPIKFDVDITSSDDGAFRIETRRLLRTDEIPTNFRSLVGDTLEVLQIEAWESASTDGSRHGTMSVEVIGVPVRLVGTLRLAVAADDATASVESFDGNLRAAIPLFGSAVERAAAPTMRAAIAVEARVGMEWLNTVQ